MVRRDYSISQHYSNNISFSYLFKQSYYSPIQQFSYFSFKRLMSSISTMKYIFITGGVVSSLGKGLTAAAIGALLEAHDYKVRIQKFDPYLNVDPGMMSPYQHGEVYVLDDGTETDLDLGHYERFTESFFNKSNSTSSGLIYQTVINNERNGVYLGGTVQIIPHISDEIKRRFVCGAEVDQLQEELRFDRASTPVERALNNLPDIVITEIGGTVGDIEQMPFLEAIRQFCQERGLNNALCIHMTLVPYLRAAGELKTKASQQSMAKLREIGIMPQILITRSEMPIGEDNKKKLQFFCNVSEVVEEVDLKSSIYEIPLYLHEQNLDEIILKKLALPSMLNDAKMERFRKIMRVINDTTRPVVNIGFVGKYLEHSDAYKSVQEALQHGAIANHLKLNLVKIDAEALSSDEQDKKTEALAKLAQVQGILIPGGFGERGTEGMVVACNYARTHNVPFLGICMGMQIAVIEFARSVCNMADANSTEFNTESKFPVIDLMEGQQNLPTGATMRLGQYRCELVENTLAYRIYGQKLVSERHRHRYEFNPRFLPELEKAGLKVSGRNPGTGLVETIELPSNTFFFGTQAHPEFKSKVFNAHPVFREFVKVAASQPK